MPIKPPNLDDRRYGDIVREARTLIPQYCPEWTNLSDADPGMTLVQLFAWMTEMTIYRLNRVPDKTYVHFLNFIGEERQAAQPSTVPLTFFVRNDNNESVEIPAYTRCSTKQTGGVDAIHFLSSEGLTVHRALLDRMVAVKAGPQPMVREIPFDRDEDLEQVAELGRGAGVQLFEMDPVEHGPHSYTPYQYLYLAHDDFRLMDFVPQPGNPPGRVRLRTATEDNLPLASLFRWERFTSYGWQPIESFLEEEEVLGLQEVTLSGHLPDLTEVESFGHEEDTFPIPDALEEERAWIRGVVDYERWLAHRMSEDLEITWRDDRGGEDRLISNWDVRATGRYLEFFIQDMPPVRPGWTVRFTMIDRSMPSGRNQYFPRYRFSYRRGEQWETIPTDRVRYQGTSIILTGPFSEMATDGYNLRAERIETVYLRGLMPTLEIEATWLRPVVIHLASGPETSDAMAIETHSLPRLPFQPATSMPPLLGMKFFMGSDVLDNRSGTPVMLEFEIGFEVDGEPVEEPVEQYHMQLTYRAADTWRVVHTDEGTFAKFTFADLDPEGALIPGRRKIRVFIEPAKSLKGQYRSVLSGRETNWLRLEMTKSQLSVPGGEKTDAPTPICLRVYAVRMGVDGVIGKDVYEQPMPGLKTATVEHRQQNRRLSRAIVRSAGRLSEHHPFDTHIDITDDVGDSGQETTHTALYMQLSEPLPIGQRHAFTFKCRGETYLPRGVQVTWEQLESVAGRPRWSRLVADDDEHAYKLQRSGTLQFPYSDPVDIASEGVWLRALLRTPPDMELPALPPVSHVMMNTVEGVNLHEFRMEKFSGQGIPHQVVQLRRSPLFLHDEDEGKTPFIHPDRFPDIRVYVTEQDEERREWRRAPGNSFLTATKDDRVFVVDAVEGTLTFGNGIRGRMVPVGNYNIAVEAYHVVPGDDGNVGPGKVEVAEGFADLVGVGNFLPANGGRNAETIEEIIRRAPSVLTSRDRAVTRLDFEVIAREASGEVARAACDGKMSDDGKIEVVILPQRRGAELIPDPFLSTGLKEHVQRYLGKRCLVNVQPRVRLATFRDVDVAVTVRLRPNTNFILVREQAHDWVRRFLDPYWGGLDGGGWPFHGTLYAQDFARMVTDIPEVRHIVDVQVYESDASGPGWERGQGTNTLVLDRQDLFVCRNVRVVSEEGL